MVEVDFDGGDLSTRVGEAFKGAFEEFAGAVEARVEAEIVDDGLVEEEGGVDAEGGEGLRHFADGVVAGEGGGRAFS